MEVETRYKPKLKILVFLSISHFFSRWGDRMWSFGVPLFLVVIHCNSLLLAAIYGLMLTLALTLFGTWVGDFVDATPRRKFVVLTLFLNNFFIFLNSFCLFIIILLTNLSISNWEPYLYSLIVLLVLFGAAARLTSLGTNISVEKDWVVVIAHKDKISLACINTNLRRIDLICKLVAPVFITMIMHFVGLLAATVVLAAWNMVSFIVETALINIVYKMEPELANKVYRHKEDLTDENNTNSNNNNESVEIAETNINNTNGTDQVELLEPSQIRERKPKTKSSQNIKQFGKRLKRKLFSLPKNFFIGWKIYWRQKVFLIGLSMASLYLTVLGFSGVTAGYFYTQGMTEFYLGLAQGVAGVAGVAATFAFPYIRRLAGAVRTGVIGISLQLFCLSFCVIGVFAPGNPTYGTPPPSAACINTANNQTNNTNPVSLLINSSNTSLINHTNTTGDDFVSNQYASLVLMVTGVVTARFGLWLFDLAVLQIIQENVIESERGVVNGIMSSMNFFNDMLHFLLVVIFPQPSQFGYLAVLSFTAIAVAWILFFLYVLRHEREALVCRKCWKRTPRGYQAGNFEHDDGSSDEYSVRLEMGGKENQGLDSNDD